jgi:hypothetical protein
VGKRERGIQNATVHRIYAHYGEDVVARVRHGTVYAVVGDPDIDGVLRGRGFAFEIKNEDGELTKIQVRRLKEYKRAGAIVGAIRSPHEAIQILELSDA